MLGRPEPACSPCPGSTIALLDFLCEKHGFVIYYISAVDLPVYRTSFGMGVVRFTTSLKHRTQTSLRALYIPSIVIQVIMFL